MDRGNDHHSTVNLRARSGHLPQPPDVIAEKRRASFADEPGLPPIRGSEDVEDEHAFVLDEVDDDDNALAADRAMAHFHRLGGPRSTSMSEPGSADQSRRRADSSPTTKDPIP